MVNWFMWLLVLLSFVIFYLYVYGNSDITCSVIFWIISLDIKDFIEIICSET